jgi:hypothetical protein
VFAEALIQVTGDSTAATAHRWIFMIQDQNAHTGLFFPEWFGILPIDDGSNGVGWFIL